MDHEERKLQTSDQSVQKSSAALETLMKLHIAHQFTHTAAVDGSKEGCEPEEIAPGRPITGTGEKQYGGEDRLARTAYGIWEGLKPFGQILCREHRFSSLRDHRSAKRLRCRTSSA